MALFSRKTGSVTLTPKIQKMNATYTEAYGGITGETDYQRKVRRRSHWVIYATTLVMAIGFSIVITGAWPYLKELSPDSSKTFLGWVIAVNPLGQMIASPLLGIWINKSGSIRGACLLTVILYIIGNVLYATLAAFGSYAKEMMLVSRFIVGLGSGNVAACRSYTASSTTIGERSTAVSIVAAAMSVGVILGPSIQSALAVAFTAENFSNSSIANVTYIFDESNVFALNVYNTAGWVAAILGFLVLLMFLPCTFKEFKLGKQLTDQPDVNPGIKYPKPDYPAVICLLIPFFFVFFVNVLIETILVPLCIDMYAWKPVKAVEYVGIGLSIAALLTLVLFLASGSIVKRWSDRKAIMFLGIIPLCIGLLILIPMGTTLPPIRNCTDPIESNSIINNLNSETIAFENSNTTLSRSKRHVTAYECASYGCPPQQEWCYNTPIIEKVQLLIASVFIVLGYPFVFGLTGAIYSKMLGPKPQGVWMGILTSTGSVSRMMGPLFVTYMYTDLGPQWTFGIVFAISMVVLAISSYFYKRFIPMKLNSAEQLQHLDT